MNCALCTLISLSAFLKAYPVPFHKYLHHNKKQKQKQKQNKQKKNHSMRISSLCVLAIRVTLIDGVLPWRIHFGDFPGDPVVKNLPCNVKLLIWSLVGKLRPQIPWRNKPVHHKKPKHSGAWVPQLEIMHATTKIPGATKKPNK